MRTHVKVLGWLQIALGALDVLMAILVFGLFAGIGFLGGVSGEPGSFIVGPAVGTVVGFLLMLTGVPNVLAGVGLLSYKGWARILAMILGALNLLKLPYGTVLGIYTFWVLLQDETEALFR